MSYKCLKIIFSFLISSLAFAAAEINDNLDTTTNLRPNSHCSVIANGNGTVSMVITSSGTADVNFYDYTYIRYRSYYDRVEITPSASISDGQYSIWILYLNSSKQIIGQVEWLSQRSDTNVQILPSVSALAKLNNINNAEYYFIRFRLHGSTSSGFIFDKIFVTEPGWMQTPLMQAAEKIVLVHEVPWYQTPEHSGANKWGSWAQGYWKDGIYYSHNPLARDVNGKPDIASVYYPSVGYYDMNDPCLVEYHCQIMKMAGIGGIIFDLGKYSGDMSKVRVMTNYLNIMAQYNLKSVVCYEDRSHWETNGITRTVAVNRAYGDMNNWLALFINSGTQYFVSGSRPLFFMFSYGNDKIDNPDKELSLLYPAEISYWLNTFFTSENRPVIMRQFGRWYDDAAYKGVLNGIYEWPMLYDGGAEWYPPYERSCNLLQNDNTLSVAKDYGQAALKNNSADFHISGVWPGFNDLAVWGWSDAPRYMPRYDGQLYDQTWDWAVDNNLPVVQVATWNDFPESTVIEPTVEFGNLYIQKTFLRGAEFKNIPVAPMPDFNVPIWIYKIRDITTDSQVLADMQTASEYIKTGQYEEASDIVSFWANFFDIDSITYWTGPGSLTAYRPGDYSHDNKINFKDIAIIGQNWQNKYHIRDLKLVADNWLEN
ncbi:MAG: hypothetical protein ABFD79_09190 [Phycisphaerales bacterium]